MLGADPCEQRIAKETKLPGQIPSGFIHLSLREAYYSRLEVCCKYLFLTDYSLSLLRALERMFFSRAGKVGLGESGKEMEP